MTTDREPPVVPPWPEQATDAEIAAWEAVRCAWVPQGRAIDAGAERRQAERVIGIGAALLLLFLIFGGRTIERHVERLEQRRKARRRTRPPSSGSLKP